MGSLLIKMIELERIIEGIISKGKGQIVQKLNEIISVIGDGAEEIGFDKVRIKEVDQMADVATIAIGLPSDYTLTVFVYDIDDIKIEIPRQVAQALNIPNYYTIRPNEMTPEDLEVLDSDMPPAVSATIKKLQEIWMQLRDHMEQAS